jgi:hypothetical protein
MEILVKQVAKEIDKKMKTFFLDETGTAYELDWVNQRYENKGFQLKEFSKFNTKDFLYKGTCQLKLASDDKAKYSSRHIFMEKASRNRFYLNDKEFSEHFEVKQN